MKYPVVRITKMPRYRAELFGIANWMCVAVRVEQRNTERNEFTGKAANGQGRALSLGVRQRVLGAAFCVANPAGDGASAHTALRAAAGECMAIGTLR